MSPEEVAAWWAAQGHPPRFSDAAHVRLAQVLRGIDQGDGAGPDRTARRRGGNKEPTAARQPRGSRGA
jgi:hypothetical protein